MNHLLPSEFLHRAPSGKAAVCYWREGKWTAERSSYGELLAEMQKEIKVLDENNASGAVTVQASHDFSFVAKLLAAWERGLAVLPLDPLMAQERSREIMRMLQQEAAGLSADARLILLTSGSTGEPKAAVLPESGLLWNSGVITNLLGYEEADTHLVLLPLFHVDAILSQLLPALAAGSTIFLSGERDPIRIAEKIRESGCNHIYLAPSLWTSLIASGAVFGKQKIKTLLSTTSPVPPELIRRIRATSPDAKFVNLYGLTESSASISAALFAPGEAEDNTVGLPLPDTSVRLSSEGELLFKGPQLFSSYLRRGGLQAPELDADGFWRTGDLARISGPGKIYLQGRVKDQFSIGGHKVSPLEIEEALIQVPGVSSVVVVSVPDLVLGESMAALVLPSENSQNTEELEKDCRRRISAFPAWKVPRDFLIVQEIPANRVGKPDRTGARVLAMKELGITE